MAMISVVEDIVQNHFRMNILKYNTKNFSKYSQ